MFELDFLLELFLLLLNVILNSLLINMVIILMVLLLIMILTITFLLNLTRFDFFDETCQMLVLVVVIFLDLFTFINLMLFLIYLRVLIGEDEFAFSHQQFYTKLLLLYFIWCFYYLVIFLTLIVIGS